MKDKEVPRYVGPQSPDRVATREEVKARFDAETARAYSQQDPVYLPEYAAALALLVEAVAQPMPDAPRILDLGAGTGNLSRRVLERFSRSTVTLLDFSQNMLDHAARVLAAYPGRHDVVCADFFQAALPDASFDAVVSSFAIHHARGRAEYAALYEKIARWLRPGCVFACCDVVKGASEAWNAIAEQGWRDHLAAHFDAATIDHIFGNYRSEDTPLPLRDHLECLRDAGFARADVLWKRHNFAVYCAQR